MYLQAVCEAQWNSNGQEFRSQPDSQVQAPTFILPYDTMVLTRVFTNSVLLFGKWVLSLEGSHRRDIQVETQATRTEMRVAIDLRRSVAIR